MRLDIGVLLFVMQFANVCKMRWAELMLRDNIEHIKARMTQTQQNITSNPTNTFNKGPNYRQKCSEQIKLSWTNVTATQTNCEYRWSKTKVGKLA